MSLWSRIASQFKFSAAGWAVSQYFFGRPVWTPRDYENFAKEAYGKNVVAFACINKMSTAIASVPLYMMDGDKELDTHPLLDLLNAPNPFQSGSDFMEALVAYYMIAGNTYVERVDSFSKKQLTGLNIPTELYILRPDRMRVIPGDRGWPMAYEYNVGGMIQRYDIDVVRRQMPVLHLKTFNPINDWYGQSLIEAAMYSVDTHTEASAWNKSLLHNSGGPPGIINIKTLTNPQREAVRKEIDDKYTGPHNAGRPMISDGEVKWIPMGFSPKDMEWINSKNVSAREICLALLTPPQILGIPGDNTYSNLQEANVAFARGGVVPLLRRIVGGLNRWLCNDFGSNLRLCYDEDTIPGLAQERRDVYAKMEAVTFLTTNEKRESTGWDAYEGDKLDPVTGELIGDKKEPADYILIGTSLMPLDDIIAPPAPPPPAVDANGDPVVPDPNAPVDPNAVPPKPAPKKPIPPKKGS